ncbi:hypothetical protein M8A51_15280 [Schlegelella sp. S2-27]|uniref:Uncharacterized protein n=1 Tax=Caldimonas mangrovi TaxID=2944811 RepID=A0ABT0YQ71_9BURK|nr:hypothetical protein [Caldimonas mangrovi]MCM5680887.1 hypothetical protein [Caldimonas mangrovi]
MDTVEEHPHSFLPGAWPFSEPINRLAYISVRALHGGDPVLQVFHDHDGDWQLLHGGATDEDDCKIICLGCAYERDSSIGILSGLPAGWAAYRESPDGPWRCEPYEDDDSEED